jgi:hypothetical protein
MATKDAVPPLTKLLADDKLGQYACVLEIMPVGCERRAAGRARSIEGNALIGG